MTLQETLSRLSKKSGVVATVVLDRTTGAVLQRKNSKSGGSPFTANTLSLGSKDTSENVSSPSADVDQFSTMIWQFVNAAGGLVSGFDTEVGLIEVCNGKK